MAVDDAERAAVRHAAALGEIRLLYGVGRFLEIESRPVLVEVELDTAGAS